MTARDEGWRNFRRLCLDAASLERLDQLFQLFLSPEERDQIALRVDLIRELIKGEKTQREIAKALEISIAKITRGSNALKIVDDALLQFLKKELL